MNERDWIPFHRRLAKGPKKSIPRGVRFVLLELCLEARRNDGVIDLPPDRDTLEALHDLIGGDRREIRKAIEIFSFRDSEGGSTLEIIKDVSRHRCVIPRFSEWAGPKPSTARVREHRENKHLRQSETFHVVANVTPTGQDSREQDSTEQDRREIARAQGANPTPQSQVRLKASRGTSLPTDWQPSDADVAFAKGKGWTAGKLEFEAERFLAHHQAKGTISKTWAGSWRTWVLQSIAYGQGNDVPPGYAPRRKAPEPLAPPPPMMDMFLAAGGGK